MKHLKKLFNIAKPTPLTNYQEFWEWFLEQAPRLKKMAERGVQGKEDLAEVIANRLNEIVDIHSTVVQAANSYTTEVVFSADGRVENFFHIEEIVQGAPTNLPGWTFTAFRQPIPVRELEVEMGGIHFSQDTITWAILPNKDQVELIDLELMVKGANPENLDICFEGLSLYFEHLLGEKDFAIQFDS
ncbi:MAG: hypothetical protein AAF840_14180, partial [Bacteroidota bacterium]